MDASLAGVRCWLVKTEPDTYSWDQLVSDRVACWDGVRNVRARNNLRAMEIGDQVFVYHTGKEKQIVGLAEVVKPAYRDPTTPSPMWSAVDLKPLRKLERPLTLKEVKSTPELSGSPLVRISRLSVMPIEEEHFKLLVEMAKSERAG